MFILSADRHIPVRGIVDSAITREAGYRALAIGLTPQSGGASPHNHNIARVSTSELIGGIDMPRGQQPAIADLLHERIHTFFVRFYDMTTDGEICEAEQEEALDELDAITAAAEYLAESHALAVATMRRGFNSKMAAELTGRMRRKANAA